MSLKEELSQKLYNTFERNNLLPYVEEITNDKNFISVDIYDLEPFESYMYIGKVEYTNKEDIPYLKGKAAKLLICLDISATTTLAEIAAFIDYISLRFDTKEMVFGTRLETSLEKGTINANILMFKEYSFKDKLQKKFFKDLIKCDFIDKLNEILIAPSIINIDIDDIATVSNDEIVGAISQNFDDLEDDFIINSISDKTPNACILHVSSGEVTLTAIDKIVDKLRLINEDMQIVFGAGTNLNLGKTIQVNALLLFTKNETKPSTIKEDLNYIKEESNKIYKENMNALKIENDLIYKVAIFCVNNPIKMNLIQNEFNLGFNRTSYILDRLEKLEIISIKLGTKPREILIKDEEEIKRRIYEIK